MTRRMDKHSAGTDIPQDNLHVYIFVGQSYLQGGSPVADHMCAPDPRILKLTGERTLEVADEPLFDSPGKDDCVGPGMYFARAMLDAAPPDVSIVLTPLGIGGERVAGWEQIVSRDYEGLVRRVRDAQSVGTVKGIVWHSGVSDSRIGLFERMYDIAFPEFISKLCKDSGLSPVIPVILGRVGPYATETDDTHFVELADRKHGMIPGYLPYCTVGEATPIPGSGKSLHYPTAAQEIMGKRYAEAMQKQTQCALVVEQGPAVWWPWMDKEENVAVGSDVGYNVKERPYEAV